METAVKGSWVKLTVPIEIVVSEDYVDVLAILVLDKEVCEGCAVFDELLIFFCEF